MGARFHPRRFVHRRLHDLALGLPWENPGIILDEFPNLRSRFGRVGARYAVQKGFKLGVELRSRGLQSSGKAAEEARKVLFGQRAR
jgi:hypothetical protein